MGDVIYPEGVWGKPRGSRIELQYDIEVLQVVHDWIIYSARRGFLSVSQKKEGIGFLLFAADADRERLFSLYGKAKGLWDPLELREGSVPMNDENFVHHHLHFQLEKFVQDGEIGGPLLSKEMKTNGSLRGFLGFQFFHPDHDYLHNDIWVSLLRRLGESVVEEYVLSSFPNVGESEPLISALQRWAASTRLHD